MPSPAVPRSVAIASKPRSVLDEPIQTRSSWSRRRFVPRDRIALRVHARRNHVDSFDFGPGSQSTVGQEIVAGDDRIGRAHRLREASRSPVDSRDHVVVGVAKLERRRRNRRRGAASSWRKARNCQPGKSLRCRITASNCGRPAELEEPKQRPSIETLVRRATSPRRRERTQKPGSGSDNRRGQAIRPGRVVSSRPP